MARNCINCNKGVAYGHAVSHAKNRVRRLFRPNIQKIKVLRDGNSVSVKMCTSCIQKLKKDGQFGLYRYISYLKADTEIKEAIAKIPKIEIPKEETVSARKKKKEDTMKIEDIVGKA